MQEYYLKNRSNILSRVQSNYKDNEEARKEYARNYYEKHKNEPDYKLRGKLYAKDFRKNNMGLINSWTAERRSKLKKSVDGTANMELIKRFYILAETLSEQTGIKYVVDHIKPIVRGGKHHQDNLQVITALDNARKGYKFPFKVESSFNPSQDSQVAVA